MPDDLEKIAHDVQMRLALVEQKLEHSYAGREWVREFTEPTRAAVVEIKSSIQSLTGEMRGLGDKVTTVFAAHDVFLEEKREAELQTAKDATPGGLVRKWTPFAALMLMLVALYRVLGTLIEHWIATLPGSG
ncbi:MAG: hypothetical protein H0W99_17775 [Acidobacteria bacterium]|nr:hypothetical protein [Acidobacteriota bacterium]